MTKETFFDLAQVARQRARVDGDGAHGRGDAVASGKWVADSTPEGLSGGANKWLMLQRADECRRHGLRQWGLCGVQFENVAKFKSDLGGDLVHGFQVVSPALFSSGATQKGRKLGARESNASAGGVADFRVNASDFSPEEDCQSEEASVTATAPFPTRALT